MSGFCNDKLSDHVTSGDEGDDTNDTNSSDTTGFKLDSQGELGQASGSGSGSGVTGNELNSDHFFGLFGSTA